MKTFSENKNITRNPLGRCPGHSISCGCICHIILFPRRNRKIIRVENSTFHVCHDVGSCLCWWYRLLYRGAEIKAMDKIKVGFLPVLSFASLLGIAIILHWDKFSHGHISFIAWAGLYFTTPFIVLTVWIRNRNQDTRRLDDHDIVIPTSVRLIIGFIGAITLIISFFIHPVSMTVPVLYFANASR